MIKEKIKHRTQFNKDNILKFIWIYRTLNAFNQYLVQSEYTNGGYLNKTRLFTLRSFCFPLVHSIRYWVWIRHREQLMQCNSLHTVNCKMNRLFTVCGQIKLKLMSYIYLPLSILANKIWNVKNGGGALKIEINFFVFNHNKWAEWHRW